MGLDEEVCGDAQACLDAAYHLQGQGAFAGEDVVTGLAPVADLAELGDSVAVEAVFDRGPLLLGEMPLVSESMLAVAGRADGKVIQRAGPSLIGPQLPGISDMEPLAEISRGHESARMQEMKLDGREVHRFTSRADR